MFWSGIIVVVRLEHDHGRVLIRHWPPPINHRCLLCLGRLMAEVDKPKNKDEDHKDAKRGTKDNWKGTLLFLQGTGWGTIGTPASVEAGEDG